jgi:CheY-like chemotaxis protein
MAEVARVRPVIVTTHDSADSIEPGWPGPPLPRRGTILLVEDHNEVRLGVAQLLELNGFIVADTADGERALGYLQAHPSGCALMLLDLLLPGLSGGDLRARQLADPALAEIPVIVVTACEPEPGVRARLRPAAWLEKPFRCDDLLTVVRRYVAPEPGRN